MVRRRHPIAWMVWLVPILILIGVSASGGGDIFQPADQSPPKGDNPCKDVQTPAGKITNEFYNSFKDMVGEVLGDKAGVIGDIDGQVKSRVPNANEKPVSIEIFVVTEEEFKQEYLDDVDSLNPGKKPAELTQEASDIFGRATAYTYITDKKNAGNVQKIKIKVFCKTSFRNGVIDESMRETLVHELVHAKLYAMRVLGVDEQVGAGEGKSPFKDHDDDSSNDDKEDGDKPFYGEVERLFKLLKTNLNLSYAPNRTQSHTVLASVMVFDPNTGGVAERVELAGEISLQSGPVADDDQDGLLEVQTEIVQMQLTGTNSIGVPLTLSSATGSVGITEELEPGIPFPAASFFDLSLILTQASRPSIQQTVVEALIHSWPPFTSTYTSDQLTPPFNVEVLQFVVSDKDEDTYPDHEDPDDDNDGIPDAEDADPLNPYAGPLNLYSYTLEIVHGTPAIIQPHLTFPDFWNAVSEGRLVSPIIIGTACLPIVGCVLQFGGGIQGVRFAVAPTGTPVQNQVSGPLPVGLQLDQPTGVIHGTPTQAGVSRSLIQAIDSNTEHVIAELWLEIQVLEVKLVTLTICAQLLSTSQEVLGVPIVIDPPGITLTTRVVVKLPLGIYSLTALTEIATATGIKSFQYWTRQDGRVIATIPVLTLTVSTDQTVCAWYK